MGKLTTRTSTKGERKPGRVRTTTPARNGTSATARLSKPRTAKPTHPCVCGCGQPTKRVFAQGHDAKVYAILRHVRDGDARTGDVPKGVRDDKALLTHMLTHVS